MSGLQTVLGSTHVVESLLFSMFSSSLSFDFDLILGSFLTFWVLNGVFGGRGVVQKNVLGSTHVVQQLLSDKVISILTFDLWLNFGVVFDILGR